MSTLIVANIHFDSTSTNRIESINDVIYIYAANASFTSNISANYYRGNGALLTGVVTDNSWANGVGVNANSYAGVMANASNTLAISAFNKANGAVVTIIDDTTSSSTYYPLLSSANSGQLTIANTSNSKLYYVPSTGTLSATAVNSISDKSLKEDIKSFDGIALLYGINPVSFVWKDTGLKSYGVIAQELEPIHPELVQTTENGIKSVSYMPMIAMLIDVVKKQEKRIDDLENRINNI